ncbi:MAG: hypothetical protein WBD40_17700 [Tepidisphaeraceae bacterium]
MFDHFLLRPIFDVAKGRLARLLMSPIIGGAAFLLFVLKSDSPPPGETWHWVAMGAGLGLLGGIILTMADASRTASPERQQAKEQLAEMLMQEGHAVDRFEAADQADAVLEEEDERRVGRVGLIFGVVVLLAAMIMVGVALLLGWHR